MPLALVTLFEPVEDGASGAGEFGVEGMRRVGSVFEGAAWMGYAKLSVRLKKNTPITALKDVSQVVIGRR